MSGRYLLGIDQGTGGTKAVIFDKCGCQIAAGYREVPLNYPRPGWVEQDPDAIWMSAVESVGEALRKGNVLASEIAVIGFANQGETIIAWDKESGRPVYRAISWMCRRTASVCEQIASTQLGREIRARTGLIVDPYFSATKIKWILDNVKEARAKVKKRQLLCGSTDAWLLWNFTKGRSFCTDYATASRTMMLNIHSLEWDEEILAALGIPEHVLAPLEPNGKIVGYTDSNSCFGKEIPVGNMIADGSAALFGQACVDAGMVNISYGTGCFVLMNIGERPVYSNRGIPTVIAWNFGKRPNYAFYGSIYSAGVGVRWLRDGLKVVDDLIDAEQMATCVEDSGGVFFVPAFEGLGAPYWDRYARGMLIGITSLTSREHVVRAVLESIAYRVHDVLHCMEEERDGPIERLRAGGRPATNRFLLQFQADILNTSIETSQVIETSALGTAFMAGLAVGFWQDKMSPEEIWKRQDMYSPKMSQQERARLLTYWNKAVQRACKWEENCGGGHRSGRGRSGR